MCQNASLPALVGLDRKSAPSDTSSLLNTSVVLAFYLVERSASWKPLCFWCTSAILALLANCGHTNR